MTSASSPPFNMETEKPVFYHRRMAFAYLITSLEDPTFRSLQVYYFG